MKNSFRRIALVGWIGFAASAVTPAQASQLVPTGESAALWIGTTRRLVSFELESDARVSRQLPIASAEAVLSVRSSGTLWFASGGFLHRTSIADPSRVDVVAPIPEAHSFPLLELDADRGAIHLTSGGSVETYTLTGDLIETRASLRAATGDERISCLDPIEGGRRWLTADELIWEERSEQQPPHRRQRGEIRQLLCDAHGGFWAVGVRELRRHDSAGRTLTELEFDSSLGPIVEAVSDPRDGAAYLAFRTAVVRFALDGTTEVLFRVDGEAITALTLEAESPEFLTRAPELRPELRMASVPAPDLGQNLAALSGRIVDSDGREIAGANVALFADELVRMPDLPSGAFDAGAIPVTRASTESLVIVTKESPSGRQFGSFETTLVGGQRAVRDLALEFDCPAGFSTEFPAATLNGDVRAMTIFDDGSGPSLYVGGTFTTAAGATVNRVARWDGTAWSALGSGLDGGESPVVNSLAVFDDGTGPRLYVGGRFTRAGSTVVNHIARWDGSNWSMVGAGLASQVNALAVHDDGSGPTLFAGGTFNQVGAARFDRIAGWNGTSWRPVSGGVDGDVLALASFDDGRGAKLYAGGRFSRAGGSVSAIGIAVWNGTSWEPLGGGVGGGATVQVNAIQPWNDGSVAALYVGGRFTTAGGATVNHVARWSAGTWSALGGGLGAQVHALTSFDDGGGSALYAVGSFKGASSSDDDRLARWNGQRWAAVGTGLNGSALSLTAGVVGGTEPSLFVGGSFSTASGTSSSRLARWRRPAACPDSTPPVLHFLEPVEGASWATAPYRVVLGVGDFGGGVDPSSLELGQGETRLPAACSFEADLATCTLLAAPNGGAITLSATIRDFAGNLSRTAFRIVELVDTSPPSIEIDEPLFGQNVATLRPALRFSYSDTESAIDTASLVVTINAQSLALECQVGATAAVCVPASALAAGEVSVSATIRDLAGNLSAPATTSFTVEAPPSYSLTFQGRAMLESGQPAAGARVSLVDRAGAYVTAAADGTFSLGPFAFSSLAAVDLSARVSVAESSGSVTYLGHLLDYAPGGGGVQAVGDILMQPRCDYFGAPLPWTASEAALYGETSADIFAMAAYDSGSGPELYVGGEFNSASQGTRSQIARWGDSGWQEAGQFEFGVQPNIRGLAIFDDGSGAALYAAGKFRNTGNGAAGHFAKWDGVQWSEVGRGVNGAVEALVTFDDGSGPALYLAGDFTSVRTSLDWTGVSQAMPANRVAKWDGESWSEVAGGFVSGAANGTARMAVLTDAQGTSLFLWEEGIPLLRLVAGVWQEIDLGSAWCGLADLVSLDDGSGPAIYRSGCGIGIDKLVGSTWVALRPYEWPDYRMQVHSTGGETWLYAAHTFPDLPGSPAESHVRRWNGGTWSAPLGEATSLVVVPGLSAAPDLFAVRRVTGTQTALTVARFDGTSFAQQLATGDSTGLVTSVAFLEEGSGYSVFFTGLERAGGVQLGGGVGRWNGTSITPASAGLPDATRVFRIFDGSSWGVYGVAAASGQIAKWGGSSWQPLGPAIGSSIQTVAAIDIGAGLQLVAAGNGVYRWNGAFWASLGGPSGVKAIESFQGQLHVAPPFSKWNGTSWVSWGSAATANGTVNALRAFQSKLHVGGEFTTAGGSTRYGYAIWNGTGWESSAGCGLVRNRFLSGTAQSPLPGKVHALELFDDLTANTSTKLLIGGDFASSCTSAGSSLSGTELAYYNVNLGSGSDAPPVLALSAGTLGGAPAAVVGGAFGSFDGESSAKLALWGAFPAFDGCSTAFRPPQITLTSPTDLTTNVSSTLFAGTVDEPSSVSLNESPVTAGPAYAFSSGGQELVEGRNPFVVEATDLTGSSSRLALEVVHDMAAPLLTIVVPRAAATVTSLRPEVDLRFSDPLSGIDLATLSVEIDGVLLPGTACVSQGDRARCVLSADLTPGGHSLEVRIEDRAGNLSQLSRAFAVDATSGSTTTIVGQIQTGSGVPAAGARVRVLGRSGFDVYSAADGTFSLPLVGLADRSPLTVVAERDEATGLTLGVAAGLVPVVGGTTQAGTIVLGPACAPQMVQGLLGALSGVTSRVTGLAVFDDGTGAAVYGASYNGFNGGGTAYDIAKLVDGRWVPFAESNGYVWTLAVHDDGNGPALYAAGNFTSIGGVSARSIARLAGSTWVPLGTGLTTGVPSSGCATGAATVRVLRSVSHPSGDLLYVGGDFFSAGGVPADLVARWNGTAWLGSTAPTCGSASRRVESLAVYDDGTGPAVFAGGFFTGIAGVPARSVAKFDGTAWSALGNGVAIVNGTTVQTGLVSSMAVFDDGEGPELIVGGMFGRAGDLPVTVGGIARWNGSRWATFGDGLDVFYTNIGEPSGVQSLLVHDDGSGPALFAAGSFDGEADAPISGIARWNGEAWLPLGSGLTVPTNGGMALLGFDGGLYVGGNFTQAGGLLTTGVARWRVSGWEVFGGALTGTVSALALHDDGTGVALYAGGSFTQAGGSALSRVARWSGGEWQPLGAGLNGNVLALASFADASGPGLFAGGSFSASGTTAAIGLARWDGATWQAVGGGVKNGSANGTVETLAVFNDGSGDDLYVGGTFTLAGTLAANRIARWDGAAWSALGTGLNNTVYALTVANAGGSPALFAGGTFTNAGGITANRIARWNGTAWSALGSGANSSVFALQPWPPATGTELLAAGNFTSVGGVSATRVARWTGAAWSNFSGAGPNGAVEALQVRREGSYDRFTLGGAFTALGGMTTNRVGQRNGSTWGTLGTGATNGVAGGNIAALLEQDEPTGRALWLGGSFTTANGIASPYIAKWERPLTCGDTVGPVVTITAPSNGAMLTDATPELSVTHVDAMSAVDPSTLVWRVNGLTAAADCNSTAAASTCTLAQPLPQGVVTLDASVRDIAGNVGTSDPVEILLDSDAPQISISTPLSDEIFETGAIAVEVSFSDLGSGILPGSFALSGTGPQAANWNCPVDEDSATCTPTSPLVEGPWILTVEISDAAGNTSEDTVIFLVDTTAPAISIEQPAPGSSYWTDSPAIRIAVSEQVSGPDAASVALLIDGLLVGSTCTTSTSELTCALSTTLAVGFHELTATVRDRAGWLSNEASAEFTIEPADSTPPTLRIVNPLSNSTFDPALSPLLLEWEDGESGIDVTSLRLSANGLEVPTTCSTNAEGAECTPNSPMSGLTLLGATVRDRAGNLGTAEPVSAMADSGEDQVPPSIVVTSPEPDSSVSSTSVVLRGRVNEPAFLTVNGAAVDVDPDLTFDTQMTLAVGTNAVTVVAIDTSSNPSTLSFTITVDSSAPDQLVSALLIVEESEDGYAPAIGEPGCAPTGEADLEVVGRTRQSGAETRALVAPDGSFSFSLDGLPQETVDLWVEDRAGNRSASIVRVLAGTTPSPSDPAGTASPLDPSVASSLCDSARFLWDGPGRVQYGVAADALDCSRLALVRGRVTDSNGLPLAGVRVVAARRPELGSAFTREDGLFDLAVNGEEGLLLRYRKSGFLEATRRMDAGWGEQLWVEDVALAAQAPALAPISLGTASHLADGPVVSDAAGTRRTTLFLPSALSATLKLSDGSTVPAPELSLRITERSAGPSGERAMALELPASWGYAYSVQVEAVEAESAGATSVEFSTPIPLLVENILGLPVGLAVPIAYLNETSWSWTAVANGRVLKLLSVANGLAEIDADGTGTPAPAQTLLDLGIGVEELEAMSVRFAIGESFVRIRLPHLTEFFGGFVQLPMGPGHPRFNSQIGPARSGGEERLDTPTLARYGGLIEVENQILGQKIGLSGTPYSLAYRSDRVPGRTAPYVLTIPLTGETVDNELLRVELTVDIAGQRVRQTFPASASQTTSLVWDGKDRFGRAVQGAERWRVEVGHVYPSTYLRPAPTDPAFLQAGAVAISGVEGRSERVVKSSSAGWMGAAQSLGAVGLGGWALDVHHSFDPETRTVYYGSGGRRTLGGEGREPEVLYRVAGTGTAGFSGDEGPAREAMLFQPVGLFVNGEGELLISDRGNCRIRRVDRQGTISTVAGTDCAEPVPGGSVGDGGPATSAQLQSPMKAIEGSDGSIFIADAEAHRVRRVDPAGEIETILGTGEWGCESGGSATSTQISTPMDLVLDRNGDLLISDAANPFISSCRSIQRLNVDGELTALVSGSGSIPESCQGPDCSPFPLIEPTGLALGPDGTVFFSQPHSIRIIPPHGGAVTDEPDWNIAGWGYAHLWGYAGDGQLASASGTYFTEPFHLARAGDGTLYIADSQNNVVRRIGPDRIVDTVAGAGTFSTLDDGFPARQVALGHIPGVALDPSGETLYFSDYTNHVVWRMSLPVPYFDGEYRIPSEDGSLLYVFDKSGRHLRTEDALHDRVLLAFDYTTYTNPDDVSGSVEWLSSITDADGRVTSIERAADGAPSAIEGPYGHRTLLAVHPVTRYLTSVRRPLTLGEERIDVDHSETGLLESLEDPKGNTYRYEYESDGRLKRVEDPLGGQRVLDLQPLGRGHRIASTSSMGRQSQTTVEFLPQEEVRQVVRDSSGFETEVRREKSGRTVTTLPDDTSIVVEESPDPRFGPLATFASISTLTTPDASLERTTTRSVTVEVSPADPLSLTQWSSSVTVNGRTSSVEFDQGTKLLTSYSPEGRASSTSFDADGRVRSGSVPGVEPIRYSYDIEGRLQKVAQGPGLAERRVVYGYDVDSGFLNRITDVRGEITTFERDRIGRITKQILPDQREVRLEYDLNGNLVSLTPPTRPEHLFSHDEADRVTSYTPPDLNPVTPEVPETSFGYNLDHQLTSVTRPDGLSTQFTYDTGGRLDYVTLPTGVIDVAYSPEDGRLASLTAPSGAVISYEMDGPALTSVTTTGVNPATVEVFYDRPYPGQLKTNFWLESTRLNESESTRIRYEYDADGLLLEAGEETIFRRADNGFVRGSSLFDSHDVVARDAYGELATYTAGVKPPGATCLFSPPAFGCVELYKEEILKRDRYGRIERRRETTRENHAAPPVVHSYDYAYDEERGWLEEVKRDGTTISTYAYDGNGNRTAWTDGWGSGAATYDAQDRMLTRGPATYTYTANGELLTKSAGGFTTGYTYDVLGNLLEVDLPDGIEIRYEIDAKSRRIGKRVDGTLVQRFVYLGGLSPMAELDAAGNVTTQYVYATGGTTPDHFLRGGATYRIYTDHLGSPRVVVNAETSEVVQRLDFDAYGRISYDSNPGFQPFGFAGGLYDHQTGLTRFGARDYDAETGRWTAKDPIGFAGGSAGLYEYVSNDPVNATDPTGLQPDRYIGMTCGADSECLARSAVAAQQGAVVGGIVGGAMVATAAAPGLWGACVLNAPQCSALGLLAVDLANPNYGDAIPPVGAMTRGTAAAVDAVASRAAEIHSVLDPIAASMRTTAVLRTGAADIIAGGGRDLSPLQRAALTSGEVAAKMPGVHAELTALSHAQAQGFSPGVLAVTRMICPQCVEAIEASGGKLTGPTTAVWP